MRTHLLLALSSLALLLPAAACSDDHGHTDPDVEGCEHLSEGPYVAVTATMASTGAPAIREDHMAYTVALPGSALTNSGFVSFAAAEAALFIFYLDQNVTAAFTTSAGAAITPQESGTSSATCTEIMGRHVVPLEVGTAFLQLSSPTISSVNVVIEPSLVDHAH